MLGLQLVDQLSRLGQVPAGNRPPEGGVGAFLVGSSLPGGLGGCGCFLCAVSGCEASTTSKPGAVEFADDAASGAHIKLCLSTHQAGTSCSSITCWPYLSSRT